MRGNYPLILLLSLALFAKALIPAGWMPSPGKAFEITVCMGVGSQSMWLDKNGTLHDENPDDEADEVQASCPFVASASLADLPSASAMPEAEVAPAGRHFAPRPAAAIGHGLAAPPPPQTGPPILI